MMISVLLLTSDSVAFLKLGAILIILFIILCGYLVHLGSPEKLRKDAERIGDKIQQRIKKDEEEFWKDFEKKHGINVFDDDSEEK